MSLDRAVAPAEENRSQDGVLIARDAGGEGAQITAVGPGQSRGQRVRIACAEHRLERQREDPHLAEGGTAGRELVDVRAVLWCERGIRSREQPPRLSRGHARWG
jgi:hypothetical protein